MDLSVFTRKGIFCLQAVLVVALSFMVLPFSESGVESRASQSRQ